MGDQTTGELRERLRDRYAAAARAVLEPVTAQAGCCDSAGCRRSYIECIAGALSRAEYLAGLAAAGFAEASVTFATPAAPGMHSAVVRAVKPGR